jgi:hypothetical protein
MLNNPNGLATDPTNEKFISHLILLIPSSKGAVTEQFFLLSVGVKQRRGAGLWRVIS